jgi:hypothetical protein
MNYTGFGQIGTPTAYLFGGGTIGGPNVWDFSSGRPLLSEAARRSGAITLPAGALSRQEIRNRSDIQQAMASGNPYVEMPTMYQLNEKGQYVDPLTGRTMGTVSINYSAGGWRNAKGEDMASGGGYSPNVQAKRARQGKNPYGPESGGYKESGGPQPAQTTQRPTTTGTLSLTPFGERVEQEFPSTVSQGVARVLVENARRWFDQEAPRFPYAGY